MRLRAVVCTELSRQKSYAIIKKYPHRSMRYAKNLSEFNDLRNQTE